MRSILLTPLHRFLLVLVIIAFATYGLWLIAGEVTTSSGGGGPHQSESVTHVFVLFIGLMPLLAVIWFLYLFGGVEVRPGRIGQIIVFCYLTTGVMIAGSLLPFVAMPLAPGLQKFMMDSPVGVIPGCRVSSDQEFVSKEIACSNHAEQWLVNIGGIMEPPSPIPINGGPPEPVVATRIAGGSNLQESIREKTWPATQIRGGLVVPLYFVVLSLIGAAVSMTRGVPDCQRRLIPGRADSITPEEARGYLVLKIMQMFSAPLIAIVTYHALQPDSAKTSVLLGFACGFASETILVLISASFKKLNPDEPASPAVSVWPDNGSNTKQDNSSTGNPPPASGPERGLPENSVRRN